MTPEELRSEMPVTNQVAYFNTGASGPSPERVVQAVCDFQSYHEFEAPGGEGMYEAGWGKMDEIRETVAGFFQAESTEIAFTRSTADSINLVAGAIDWQPGDKIVRTDLEHPAGVLPWQRLADTHGVEVAVVESDGGRIDRDAWAGAVADADFVFLSSLSWGFGTRLPVADLVEIAHEAGALVLVDAVQSIGQHPVDVTEWGADFIAGSAHKWPLGPWGSGVLYVSNAARPQLRPTRIGGHSVTDGYGEDYSYEERAAFFEVSTGPTAIYCGMETALETIRAVGFDTIEGRVERLTARLKDGIPEEQLLSPRDYESGLVSWRVSDPESFVEQCRANDIVLRTIPTLGAVRASIHVFNTADEVDALREML